MVLTLIIGNLQWSAAGLIGPRPFGRIFFRRMADGIFGAIILVTGLAMILKNAPAKPGPSPALRSFILCC